MQPLDDTDPSSIGPYSPTHRLGTGKIGQTYLASAPEGDTVVVKVIRPEFAKDPDFHVRFTRESASARELDGEHTVKVLDADPDAETPWIATEYVDGMSLAQVVRGFDALGPGPLRILATGLAKALDSLHRHDLVHGDLNPDDVLLVEEGPRLVDFGVGRLATLLPPDPHDLDTGPAPGVSPDVGTGHLVAADGTPSAPAPVGQPRIEGPAPEDDEGDEEREIDPDPVPTTTENERGPRFLHHLAYKAPEQVQGRAGNPASDMFSLATVLVYAATGANPFEGRSDEETADRLTGPAPGTEDLPILLRTLVAACWNRNPESRPTSAQFLAALANSEPPAASPAPPADPQPAPQQTGTFRIPGATPGQGHPNPQRTGTFSRPRFESAPAHHGPAEHTAVGRWAIAVRGGPVTAPQFGALPPCPQGHPAGTAKVGPDGRLVAVASTGAICLWDGHTGAHLGEFTGFRKQVHDLAFNAEGTLLATAHRDLSVRVWDLASMHSLGVLSGHNHAVHSVTFAPGGRVLASGGEDGTVHLWDLTTGAPTTTLTGHTGAVRTIAFSRDGARVVTAGLDGRVCLWRSGGGPAHQLPLQLPAHATVTAALFSPDDSHVVTGDTTGAVRTWDIARGAVGRVFPVHRNTLSDLRFSADGSALVTAGLDGHVFLRDAVSYAPAASLQGSRHGVAAVSITRDGGLVLASGNGGPVLVWRL